MAFRSHPEPAAIKKAALYLRVSTGRQAAGDVSIPSQRDLTRRYCEGQGWSVVEEFVERPAPLPRTIAGRSSSACSKRPRPLIVGST
jgi:hypothetical protein